MAGHARTRLSKRHAKPFPPSSAILSHQAAMITRPRQAPRPAGHVGLDTAGRGGAHHSVGPGRPHSRLRAPPLAGRPVARARRPTWQGRSGGGSQSVSPARWLCCPLPSCEMVASSEIRAGSIPMAMGGETNTVPPQAHPTQGSSENSCS